MVEWKDIDGYEGLYQVSNTGEVKSVERMINKHIVKEKIMAKISGSDNEHEYVSLSDGHGGRKKCVERMRIPIQGAAVVAMAAPFIPRCSGKMKR